MGITNLLNKDNSLDNIKNLIYTPSTPEAPDVVDFENFATGTACIEASIKHTVLTLKLRSSHLGGEVIMDSIIPILEAMLGIENPPFQIHELEDFNMDLGISKISSPKIGDIPQCLSDTLTGKLSTHGPDLMKDILNPFNSAINGINSLTSEASGHINEALHSFTGSINTLVNSANKVLSNYIKSVVDPTDLVLFTKVDLLYKYLLDTNYINDYKNWKDITKCIKQNCKPIANEILSDDFLWYDEKHKEFIMPIDLNNGRIRFSKFFRTLTKEQLRKCFEIEKRYYKYLNDKKRIARAAAEKIRQQKIADDKNPFEIIVSSIISSRNNIVNTLF